MDKSEITGIEVDNPARGRYKVFLDGAYAFTLHERALAELGLKVGQAVNARSLDQIAKSEEESRAFETALRFLKSRNRTAGEIDEKLGKQGYEEQTVAKVVERLQELGLVDDAQYVEWWICHSLNHRSVGRIKLAQELMLKGLDRAVIEEKLPTLFPEDREMELAIRLAKAKSGGELRAVDSKSKSRLAAMLCRRGFSYDLVEAALSSEAFTSGEEASE